MEVDDDNDPTPENVPDSNQTAAAPSIFGEWNETAIDLQKIGPEVNAKLTMDCIAQDSSKKNITMLTFQ